MEIESESPSVIEKDHQINEQDLLEKAYQAEKELKEVINIISYFWINDFICVLFCSKFQIFAFTKINFQFYSF